MKQSRWKSPVVYISLGGAIGIILQAFGVFDKLGLTSVSWDTAINSICTAAVALGILNNPTDSTKF